MTTDAGRDMRILLVEDSPTTLATFVKLVERLDGCVPVPYADPADLVVGLPQVEFDIAVLDYHMPSHTGLELIDRIIASPQHKDALIVIVTAEDEPSIRLAALENGAIDFLRKPVDPVEFTARIRNLARLREAQIAMADREEWLRREVDKATVQLRYREEEIILRLTRAAGYKDTETARHTERVALYSGVIARHLGLSETFCRDIELAAPMHDIGKVGIREAVLQKQGKLNAEETADMRRHTVIGSEILGDSRSDLLQLAAAIAESHHEHFDGGGYPAGLAGEKIPLAGRIVAIADCFDALTTERPYKSAWSAAEAAAYIRARSGSQFDPECVDAFVQCAPEIFRICRENADEPLPALQAFSAA